MSHHSFQILVCGIWFQAPKSFCCHSVFVSLSRKSGGHDNDGAVLLLYVRARFRWHGDVTPLPKKLPWLPVAREIKFRVFSLMFKVIHNLDNEPFLASLPFSHAVLATSRGSVLNKALPLALECSPTPHPSG